MPHPRHPPAPIAWPGFAANGALLLPLEAAHLQTRWGELCRVDGHVLTRKSEFHVTVLDREQARAARDGMSPGELQALYARSCWQPRRTDRYALLHEAAGTVERWSLIEHLELPAMHEFRAALCRRLGHLFADPVPHVTHYVAGDGRGIGLPDAQALASRWVRDVPPPMPEGHAC